MEVPGLADVTFMSAFGAAFVLVFALALPLLLLRPDPARAQGIRTIVVLGSGGHTTGNKSCVLVRFSHMHLTTPCLL